ncbi:MAG: hypothetical protein KBD47_02755 [Candidatus Pacebacteria bacterium]|nr:hypothetical protein [Candidatus Paceibacterota bacterium]
MLLATLFVSASLVFIAIQLDEWDYFSLPLNMRLIVGSTPVAFGETLIYIGLPITLACRLTKRFGIVFILMLPMTALFVSWHEHIDNSTLLFMIEILLCLVFLRLSRWGTDPIPGLMYTGTVHWIANLVVVAVARVLT